MDLAAAITAGGASRRFGADKARHLWQGRTLLEHVAGSLEMCSPKLLIAPPGKYDLPSWRTIPDGRPGEGPLAGLESALSEVPGWLAFAAVDLPHLTPLFWQLLARQRCHHALAVCPLDHDGRPQPLAALYHANLLPAVSRLLDSGERRLREVLTASETCFLPWPALADLGASLFHNVNYPADAP
ncbi:molybdenum cofactor guanylyltransferase [Deinococcus peraridilitoris]|uniref:Molybdopterin-guanine dinucleotide biosynthesis protein A n=1 Tax=Deinococcus peraridilitoris (strain DSM 19664 / LMG 22246 / CIP 109416 / KR-200) TaxID=937777 RepID=L0A612_DEIPD|nr:molybdenum cofactor guanylyltransferase [Deinococcus peraridilitoris]AFZ68889.1 molybdopterin-guanine dinucleotide biosynthesis protein A [Deinococcus peraridilitoris DSM 19664]